MDDNRWRRSNLEAWMIAAGVIVTVSGIIMILIAVTVR